MNDVFVFEIIVNMFNSQQLVEKFNILAGNLFQAHHIVVDMIFNDVEPRYKNLPVEIGSIRRVYSVSAIANPEFVLNMLDAEDESENEYDGSLPLKVAENMTDEETMQFDCIQCGDPIRVPQNMLFPFVRCSSCHTDMFRKYIKNAGGIYYYEDPNQPKKK